MSEVIHHLPSKVGVLIGKEVAHGTKSTTINLVAGRGVVFAESVSDNVTEIYDPAAGQALIETVQGVKDVGGALNFQLVDWQWLYWLLGTEVMDEIQIGNVVGVFAPADSIVGQTSGFTATVDSVSGTILTLSSITGTPVQGETFDDGGAKTATLDAFIHDITLGDYPVSLTVENIFVQLAESENYLGMRGSEGSFTSARGDPISVDLSLVGIDEETNNVDPSSRASTSKTVWVWDNGSIVLNGVNLDNVCDTASLKIIRNCSAQGGHNRIAHEVVPGNFKVEVTLDMNLPSSNARVLRRNNTKSVVTLTYVNLTNFQTALITLTDVQLMSDPRDTSKDAETVRVSAVGVTGKITGRIFDDIFAY